MSILSVLRPASAPIDSFSALPHLVLGRLFAFVPSLLFTTYSLPLVHRERSPWPLPLQCLCLPSQRQGHISGGLAHPAACPVHASDPGSRSWVGVESGLFYLTGSWALDYWVDRIGRKMICRKKAEMKKEEEKVEDNQTARLPTEYLSNNPVTRSLTR